MALILPKKKSIALKPPVQGDQSCMVQRDMKQWAQKEGMWPMSQYTHIVDAHARHRGWTQEGFTGMEIVE